MHFMLAPWGQEARLQEPTEIVSACHHSGVEIRVRLQGGRPVHKSHPQSRVVFTAPLRVWYDDLIDT